jgi:RNA polymerase sigma-70 factor (family 1)
MQSSSDTDYATLSDALLVKLLRTDDVEAFQEIYRRYWHTLFLIARRKLYSQENAEEIVQDLFASIWSRRTDTQIEDLKKYLFSSVKYLIINSIKSKIVRQEYENQTASTSTFDTTRRTEEELAYRDLHQAIEDGLLRLPEKTQQIFRLNRLENQSVREISLLLNIPERTVEYHITQSLRSLRLHLRDYLLSTLLLFITRCIS